MIKSLLVTLGAVVLSASILHAAPVRSFGGARGFNGGARSSFGGAQVRPTANYSRGAFGNTVRNGYRGGGYRGGGHHGGYYGGHHGHHHGHRYYYGGVPYFYDPFFFGFGYGYYGSSFGYPYGYGGSNGYGYNNAAYYNGRVADDRDDDSDRDPDLAALPKEVQRQLSKRGYYKGSVDGEFGPASKSALTRFQRDKGIRATGRVDGSTLKALGFEDRDNS